MTPVVLNEHRIDTRALAVDVGMLKPRHTDIRPALAFLEHGNTAHEGAVRTLDELQMNLGFGVVSKRHQPIQSAHECHRCARPSRDVSGLLSGAVVGVLSGPSHAEEVSRGIPTAIVSASVNQKTASLVQNLFMTPYFRVYANLDIVGVELGGALKNIIAVAAGICDGAGFGDNTKAALITRGLVEINRLGVKMGAKPDTFAGLSGMGDLIVTCMSQHSRNRYVGEQIGKGRKLQDVLDEMVMVAEGVKTTASAYELSKK